MKTTINILGGLALCAAVFTSCERDITSLNVDPKHPGTVLSGNLVASTEQVLFDQMVTPSVNFNISRFFTQQWTETQYIDETNYNFVTRNQPQNHYNTMMRRVIQPLSVAAANIANETEAASYTPDQVAKVKANKKAITEIMSVFAWKNLVETYGNVPYTEALKYTTGNEVLQPKYDDAATIYADLIKRLDAAIASTTPTLPGFDNEIVYHGDMTNWLKVANSIKLEMGLMLSDVDAAKARTLVETAYKAGVILNQSDDFGLKYENGQFSNPIYQNLVASGRNDFIVSDVYINSLKSKGDPRRFEFFAENRNATLGTVSSVKTTVDNITNVSTTVITFKDDFSAATNKLLSAANASGNNAVFKDLPSKDDVLPSNEDDALLGYVVANTSNTITVINARQKIQADDVINLEQYVGGPYGNLATFANFTHVSRSQKLPTATGVIIDQVQVKFELAEAAARGFNVGKTASEWYNDAVLSSMTQWNVSTEDAQKYLDVHPYNAANWKKSIGEEAWVAMYNRGFEAWNIWRRLDYPSFTKPGNAESLVYRMPYSFNEYSTNKANVEAAAAAIGKDTYGTKLFFDKY